MRSINFTPQLYQDVTHYQDNASTMLIPESSTIIVALLVILLPLAVLFVGPRVIYSIGQAVGNIYKSRTARRRAQLLEVCRQEEIKFASQSPRRDSDEWEKVDSDTGTVLDSKHKGRDWNGIVGFFHPFW